MKTFGSHKQLNESDKKNRAIDNFGIKSVTPPTPHSIGSGSIHIQRKPNCACGGGCPRCMEEELETLQPKLRINDPNDRYEIEADRIADQVIHQQGNKHTAAGLGGHISPLSVIPGEVKPAHINLKSTGNKQKNTSRDFINQLNATKGDGAPLPDESRQEMERSFGEKFDRVRIHHSGRSAALNKAINARAFTHGRDIYFGEGSYQPTTMEGKRLMAHELTHVIQQKKANSHHAYQLQRSNGSTDLSGLARRRYRGCSGNQHFALDLALMRAPLWVSYTISELERLLQPHSTITVAESALNRFFPPPQRPGRIGLRNTAQTIRLIIRRLRHINRTLRNPRLFRCVSRRTCGRENSDYDPDALGYAGFGTVVSLCPAFFANDQTNNGQILTLIHESAHRIGLMRNVIERDDIMQLTLPQALTNAESYTALVQETFLGPPLSRTAPRKPPELTENWSTAYYQTELIFQEPIQGTFYHGRGEQSYPSSRQQLFNDPFSTTNQKLRFRGRINFYVDTRQVRMPPETTIPSVSVQILQDTSGTPSGVIELLQRDYTGAQYVGPRQPLRLPSTNSFDFWVSNSGRVNIKLWFDTWTSMFDDTILVMTDAII